MKETSKRLRKDAERNRLALILAARNVMREQAGDLPLELIAERAGITRGTLYRNFSHRLDLYKEVLRYELEHMSEQLRSQELGHLDFFRRLVDLTIVYGNFLKLLPTMPEFDPSDLETDVMLGEAIRPAMLKAQQAGHIRADLTPDDLLVASRMVASDWTHDGSPDMNRVIQRRISLIMNGIGIALSGDNK